MENTPQIIMTVTVAMIVLGVGVFAFFVVNSQIGYTKERVETFSVSDPTVANTFTTSYFIESVKLVEQYNGIQWLTVGAGDWGQTGAKTIVVQASGMQG